MNAEGILSVPNAEVVFLLEQYDLLVPELRKTQELLSAANTRIVELDQVAFNLAQKANVGMSETEELDGQKVKITAEPTE